MLLVSDPNQVTVLFRIFFFNDTATTEIYTLSLHDALPISQREPSRFIAQHCSVDTDHTSRPAKNTSPGQSRSEEHTSELQSQSNLVCRLLLQKKNRLSPPHLHRSGHRSGKHTTYHQSPTQL